MCRWWRGSLVLIALCWVASSAPAQDASPAATPVPPMLGVLALRFTPVHNAQLAIWIERTTGEFMSTVRLTEAVAYRGIGNRPGASEMNSGFRWPYGRREGVLPIWAKRRASAPGAKLFRTVIFQDRATEGLASRTSNDNSKDDYFCLSFNPAGAKKDALDAVSCASMFSSDKGRFLTQADADAAYAEPYEQTNGAHTGTMRPLSLDSLYPPRRDIMESCGKDCNQHADVETFRTHAHDVMPDIDAVTMATPEGEMPQEILYTIPADWKLGDYRACIEINVEGDYNATFNDGALPTPTQPAMCPRATGSLGGTCWDSWAITFGYPYRGQPSVVYCTDFHVGDTEERTFTTDKPAGSAGSWEIDSPDFGELQPMDGMTDDPVGAPGSGADRLELTGAGVRFEAVVKPPRSCMEDKAPSAVTALQVQTYPDKLNAHQWARVRFDAASDDLGVFRYDVRVSTTPITDDASFMAAMPAKQASIEAAELSVPTDVKAGQPIQVDMGGLVQATHYFVAVRAMDACTRVGPIRSAEYTTKTRQFATVSPCFVATAAYGSPLARDVGLLRRVRDRYLLTNDLGRTFVSAYYAVGPTFADAIREHDGLRALARAALTPVVELARRLDE
jgi:hypothetical protein